MDHCHCQRCGAEQVTAPLSVARTKLAKSRYKLASHIFSNVTLFFIYFFDPFFWIFPPSCLPLVCITLPNPFTSQTGGKISSKLQTGIKTGKPPAFLVLSCSITYVLNINRTHSCKHAAGRGL